MFFIFSIKITKWHRVKARIMLKYIYCIIIFTKNEKKKKRANK